MSPSSYVMMIGVISVIEGYALYCFLCLIVSNLGGPLATIDLMRNSDRELFCGICCPSDSAMFYDKATWAMFHVLVTRTIIHIFSAISFYAGTPTGLLAYGILNLISAAIIIHGVLCLVILYESVFSYCTNLFGVMKLVLLKICVGVIVIQGLIATFLYSSGATPYQDDDNRSAEDKTQRAYCLLVLCEFALLSVFYYYAFGAHVITPASAPRAVHNVSTDVKTIHSMSGVASVETIVYSFTGYLADVFNLFDIVGSLDWRESEGEVVSGGSGGSRGRNRNSSSGGGRGGGVSGGSAGNPLYEPLNPTVGGMVDDDNAYDDEEQQQQWKRKGGGYSAQDLGSNNNNNNHNNNIHTYSALHKDVPNDDDDKNDICTTYASQVVVQQQPLPPPPGPGLQEEQLQEEHATSSMVVVGTSAAAAAIVSPRVDMGAIYSAQDPFLQDADKVDSACCAPQQNKNSATSNSSSSNAQPTGDSDGGLSVVNDHVDSAADDNHNNHNNNNNNNNNNSSSNNEDDDSSSTGSSNHSRSTGSSDPCGRLSLDDSLVRDTSAGRENFMSRDNSAVSVGSAMSVGAPRDISPGYKNTPRISTSAGSRGTAAAKRLDQKHPPAEQGSREHTTTAGTTTTATGTRSNDTSASQVPPPALGVAYLRQSPGQQSSEPQTVTSMSDGKQFSVMQSAGVKPSDISPENKIKEKLSPAQKLARQRSRQLKKQQENLSVPLEVESATSRSNGNSTGGAVSNTAHPQDSVEITTPSSISSSNDTKSVLSPHIQYESVYNDYPDVCDRNEGNRLEEQFQEHA